jgi:hypothetical protein
MPMSENMLTPISITFTSAIRPKYSGASRRVRIMELAKRKACAPP